MQVSILSDIDECGTPELISEHLVSKKDSGLACVACKNTALLLYPRETPGISMVYTIFHKYRGY